MNYNGKELVEMTTETWDGNTREMLVWSDYDAKPTLALVCGFTRKGHPIADTRKESDGFKRFNVFQHCAEIPKEESIEDLKEHINIADSKVDEITRAYIIPAIEARIITNDDENAIRTIMRQIGTSINTAVKYGRTEASYFLYTDFEERYVNTVIAALTRHGYVASSRTTADCPSGIIDIKW